MESVNEATKSSFWSYFRRGASFLLLAALPWSVQATAHITPAAKPRAAVAVARTPRVRVVQVHPAAAPVDLTLPGNVQALIETPLYARADGYLRRRLVDIGDRVKAGQVLLELDTPELDQQVFQAEAGLRQARAGLRTADANLNRAVVNAQLAHITLERYGTLLKKGSVPLQEFDVREAGYRSSQAEVDSARANQQNARETVAGAEANVKRVQAQQEFKQLRAPFDGIITARNVDVGALVSTGSNAGRDLLRLAQMGTMRIFVDVPQSSVAGIRQGQPAVVSLQEMPGERFGGVVTRAASALVPSTRTMLTEVQVPNPEGRLFPGMYAQVRFTSERSRPPVVVPGDALLVRSSGTMVVVVAGNRVHFQPVVLGRDFGAHAEIRTGLHGDEQLVLNPGDDIQEGAEVVPLRQG